MNSKYTSRTPDIDIDACADSVGGKMNLILIAAQRARDLRSKHLKGSRQEHVNFATEALLDIQSGKVDKDYRLTKVFGEVEEEEDGDNNNNNNIKE